MTAALAAVLLSAAPPAPRVWDVPQPLGAVDVPRPVEAAGLAVSMHAVRSKARLEVVFADFRRQFLKAGLFLPPPRDQPQLTAHPQLTGIDPETLIAYTVFFQVNPDRTTTVILTETPVTPPSKQAPVVGFAPLMPGAREVLQSRTEGLEAVSYRAKGTADEARGFHAETLKAAGYREASPGRWERRGEAVQVKVRPLPGGEVTVQLVHGAGG